LLQIGYFIFRSTPAVESMNSFSHDLETQAQIDALKTNALRKDSNKIYPFNPNFITDYKGYTLGMSVAEIDRLHAFRASNKYVNTPEEFQIVTSVSDSLLEAIAPNFKFPEWTKKQPIKRKKHSNDIILAKEIQDLNSATVQDFIAIQGVGEKLAARIVKFRNRLGGFLVNEQVYDVYYLEQEVATRILQKYKVFNKPVIQKINVNTATAYEMSSLVYINYGLAKNIVSHREENGAFSSLNELENIVDFPAEKIDRIALYLSI